MSTTTIHGPNYGPIGDHNRQVIRNSFNTTHAAPAADLPTLLQQLRAEVDEMKAKDARALEQHLAALDEEAAKEQPDGQRALLSAEGLVDAAKATATATPFLISAAQKVLEYWQGLQG